MIGKFQLLMVEPKSLIRAWRDIKPRIGFSEGRLVLYFEEWFNDLKSCLEEEHDPVVCADIDSSLVGQNFSMSEEFFYPAVQIGRRRYETYCEESNNFKGVDIAVDSVHRCNDCIRPDDCLTDKRLTTREFREGNYQEI